MSLQSSPCVLFPGAGIQSQGMGRALLKLDAARKILERVAPLLGSDLIHLLTEASDEELIRNRNVHRVVHAHHLGHWVAFQALRQEPVGGVLSMSSGTAAALVAAGAMSIEDSCVYAAERTVIFEGVCAKLRGRYGCVIVICEDGGDPRSYIRQMPALSPTFHVAPWKTVVSGLHEEISRFRELAQRQRWPVLINDVQVEAPYHTTAFTSCKPALRRCVEKLDVRRPRIPLFLGASGKREEDPGRLREFLVESADKAEPYYEALQATYDFGLREFLEIGHDPKVERYVVGRILDSEGALAADVRCRALSTRMLLSPSGVAS